LVHPLQVGGAMIDNNEQKVDYDHIYQQQLDTGVVVTIKSKFDDFFVSLETDDALAEWQISSEEASAICHGLAKVLEAYVQD
jgi:hypothetical protein